MLTSASNNTGTNSSIGLYRLCFEGYIREFVIHCVLAFPRLVATIRCEQSKCHTKEGTDVLQFISELLVNGTKGSQMNNPWGNGLVLCVCFRRMNPGRHNSHKHQDR